jgi:hypothetical protein
MLRLLFAALLMLAVASATSAQRGFPPAGMMEPEGFHLPEGSEDYCNQPNVYCADAQPPPDDPDDPEPDEPEPDDDTDSDDDDSDDPPGTITDGMTQAADAVGDVISDDRETGDPGVQLIIWMADTFGPNIPTDPGPGDSDPDGINDSDGGSDADDDPDKDSPDGSDPDQDTPGGSASQSPAPSGPSGGEEQTVLAFRIGGERTADRVAEYFSEMQEGEVIPLSDAKGEVRFMSIDEAPNRQRGHYVVSLYAESERPEYVLVYFDGKWTYVVVKRRTK